MKYPKEKYYSCYSPKLRDYLEQFGFEPTDSFKHIETKRTCWVYIKDERLVPFLESWTQNKTVRE